MGKKKTGKTEPVWDKFVECTPYMNGKPAPELLQEGETMWQNRFYVVFVTPMTNAGLHGPVHLSIRSQNRKAIRDWRHLQRIKNELVAPYREAIEIFPPEHLMIDTANQYHLWVLTAGKTTPFTWQEGRVVGELGDQHVDDWLEHYGYDTEQIKNSKQRPRTEG